VRSSQVPDQACVLPCSRGPGETGSGCRGLPARLYDMVPHMKTILNIDDAVMAELEREAARQGRTMLELVEGALRGFD